MQISERVYLERDNTIVRELLKNGSPLSSSDKTAITRVQAWFDDDVCLDTDDEDGTIEYDSSTGYVTIQAGNVSGLENGKHTVKLTVFDSENTNGLAWGSWVAHIRDWPGPD